MDVYEPLRDRFAFRLGEVARAWRLQADRKLRIHGLTLAQWLVLRALDRHGEGLVQREIAKEIGVEGPTLVRLLDKLAEADLIERRELAHDRRYKTVLLSAKAKERIPEFQDVLAQVRYDFLTNVDEEDLEVCLRVFDRLLSHSPKD